MTNEHDITIGDHYRLKKQFDHCSVGVVWEAIDIRTGEDVAVKIIQQVIDGSSTHKAAFFEDVDKLMAIDSPGVVRVTDVLNDLPDGQVGFVMERLRGQDLGQLVSTLDLDEVLDIFISVATSLQRLHKAEIVHRNLKLSNIFCCTTKAGPPQAKLIGFGFASALGDHAIVSSTGTAVRHGPMAPESYWFSNKEKRPSLPSEDQWGFGVALYQTLGDGGGPFTAKGYNVINQIHHDLPAYLVMSPRLGAGPCPPVLWSILFRMLEKEPTERYENFHDVAEALRTSRTDLYGEAVLGEIRESLATEPKTAANPDLDGSDLQTVLEVGVPVREPLCLPVAAELTMEFDVAKTVPAPLVTPQPDVAKTVPAPLVTPRPSDWNRVLIAVCVAAVFGGGLLLGRLIT